MFENRFLGRLNAAMSENYIAADALSMLNMIRGLYVVLDPEGAIVSLASCLDEQLGYASDDLCGKKWSDVFVPMAIDAPATPPLHGASFDHDKHLYVNKIITKAGKPLFLQWCFQRVLDAAGKVTCVRCVGQDISSRVAEMQALQQRHCELIEKNRILNSLYKIAQIAVDERHSLDEMLKGMLDLTHQAFEDPQTVAVAIHLGKHGCQTHQFEASQHRHAKNILVQGRKRGRVEAGFLIRPNASKSERMAFSDEEQKLLESVARKAAFILERHKADEKKREMEGHLRHADRLATIGQLAAGIAHELNNPLGDILGFAQLASNYPDLPEAAYQDLVKIVKSTLYAREVIKKILLFSRQTLPREAKANLNTLIKEWLDFIRFRCAQNDIEIELEMDQNLPSVSGDPAQLNQVLINLVVNAIHAMPEGGTLTIKTALAPEGVYMLVADTGTGIQKDIKDKIFLPFFTTKEVDQGTGLGLSVVYGIINEHGGAVTVDSRVGEGSRFKVTLPF